jgi:D-alanyl-D-alanine carboxypeptidase
MVRMFQACCDFATPAPADSQAEALTQTEQRVRRMVDDEKSVPGIQYLVVDAEHTVSAVCHGRLDMGHAHELVRPQTRFMAYSTTKIITAIAVLQLVERGRMELDAPLTTYFQDHPYGDHVTIRMLLNHTSGIPNPIPSDWFVTDEGIKTLDRDMALEKMLRDHPNLDFEPGSKYGYSNIAYWLLEKAHEAASGQSFVDYVQERIFYPLSIESTDASFILPPQDQDLATGHIRRYSLSNLIFYLISPSAYWIEPSHGWSRFTRMHHLGFGYGGLYCSSNAFGVILQDLLKDKSNVLMKPKTKKLFFSPQQTACGETIQGTLGGWVIGKLDGIPYYSKPGGGFGFHGNVRIYPTLDVATVFFANSTEISPGPIHARSDALDAPYVAWKKGASF